MTKTPIDRRNGYSLEYDLMPILRGEVELPNFEELPLETGIANIAGGGGMTAYPGVMNAKVPGSQSTWGHWARYFLSTTQRGGLDGTGYVIWYASGVGHVGRFAVCDHKVQSTGTREQEMRGWHPGYCAKCGLNMSVDSGD